MFAYGMPVCVRTLPGYGLTWGLLVAALLVVNGTVHPLSAQPEAEVTVGNDFGVGARAMAMGGAHIAVAEDFTAAYWNPAGLTRVKRVELYATFSHEIQERQTRYFGRVQKAPFSNTHPNAIGLTIPVPTYRGSLVFAFGVQRVQSYDARFRVEGFNTNAADETYGHFLVFQKDTALGGLYAWSLSGGVDLSPDLSVGASLLLFRGNRRFDFDLVARDEQNRNAELGAFTLTDRIDRKYSGFSGLAGVLYRFGPHIQIGTIMALPVRLNVEEDWTQADRYFFDDGHAESIDDTGFFPYRVSLPFEFGSGIALGFPHLLLAADVRYRDWQQTSYDEPPTTDQSNDDFRTIYRGTTRLHLGMELLIPVLSIKLRAGYYRDPIPYLGKAITTDRRFLTAGVGILLDQILSLDLAWAHGLWRQQQPQLSEESRIDRAFVTIAYRF